MSENSEVCPKCRKQLEIPPIERVERVRNIPARLIYNCPYCQTPFYVRDSADEN